MQRVTRALLGECVVDVCSIAHGLYRAIVRLYGVGADTADETTGLPSKLYMALEYMGGGTLADLVQRQMLTPQYKIYSLIDALRWSIQISSALAYLHNSKPMLIHRDLKPDNIMLTKDLVSAKLIDFGLHSRIRRPDKRDMCTYIQQVLANVDAAADDEDDDECVSFNIVSKHAVVNSTVSTAFGECSASLPFRMTCSTE